MAIAIVKPVVPVQGLDTNTKQGSQQEYSNSKKSGKADFEKYLKDAKEAHKTHKKSEADSDK